MKSQQEAAKRRGWGIYACEYEQIRSSKDDHKENLTVFNPAKGAQQESQYRLSNKPYT
jgi:hypothetical protein